MSNSEKERMRRALLEFRSEKPASFPPNTPLELLSRVMSDTLRREFPDRKPGQGISASPMPPPLPREPDTTRREARKPALPSLPGAQVIPETSYPLASPEPLHSGSEPAPLPPIAPVPMLVDELPSCVPSALPLPPVLGKVLPVPQAPGKTPPR